MKIKILGTGCYQCIKLEEMINQLIQELGLQGVSIERISDERTIRKYMPPSEIPGLVIDDYLVSTRQPLDRDALEGWLKGLEQPTG